MLMRGLLVASIAVVLTSCAITHETSVVVGKTRAPTKPDQIKLYTKAPTRYEEIAIISADAAHDFMAKQELMNITIANLKAEAAKVGANGILLDNLGDSYIGSSGIAVLPAARKGAPVMAFGSDNARTGKQANGKAIFVIQE